MDLVAERGSRRAIRRSPGSASSRCRRNSTPPSLADAVRRLARADQERAARPEAHRRPRQHLRLRGAVSRPAVAAAAGISRWPTGGNPTAAAHALRQAIRAVLEEAIAAGGSTLRDHRQADGELGYFQHSFAVYDREGAACPRRAAGNHQPADAVRAGRPSIVRSARSSGVGPCRRPRRPSAQASGGWATAAGSPNPLVTGVKTAEFAERAAFAAASAAKPLIELAFWRGMEACSGTAENFRRSSGFQRRAGEPKA